MLIGTDTFRALVEIEAEAREIEGLRLVTLTHPTGGRPPEEIAEKCAAAYPELVKLLDIKKTGIG